MRYLSLFSGIEAVSVAWSGLDMEPVAFCEIDSFPSAVLAHRFPDVPNLGDITKVVWEEFKKEHGTIDLVVGGSPCQSFSIAGGRESLQGESALCFEYWRAVRDIRPKWFLWENVPGVFSTRDNAFGQFLGKMEELGYGMAWRTLDAQFFGVAQRRRRVFLVGCLGSGGGATAVLFESESVSGNTRSSKQKREELAGAAEKRSGIGSKCLTPWDCESKRIYGLNGVAPTLTSGANEGKNIQPSVMAFNETQITSPENGNRPDFGQECHTLSAKDHPPCIALQSDGSTSRNSHGDGFQTDGSAYTLNCIDRQSVVCMTNDTANAAIDSNMSGTLLAGGGSPPLIAAAHSALGITKESETKTLNRES